MHGLRPRDTIQPLNQMDPLTRGALFHDVQREFFERAAAGKLLPVHTSNVQPCRDLLDAALNDTAEHYHDKLSPAIARVWRAEIEDLRTDLHGWLEQIASGSEWMPEHYELAFGLRDNAGRDAASEPEPVTLDSGVKLRGAIDLIERHVTRGTLRVVDHKTGKAPERRLSIVGGGASLQPLLYALAAEKRLGAPVESGRLSFCTQRGNYQVVEVPVTTDTRFRISRVLDIIDTAIASGNLPAAPSRDACKTCDCRCVCGPHEQIRWLRKTTALDDLLELRNMP
jgi:CRISPR/Cas system-associated exonuclease Cas4 (RecB family)